MKDLEHKEMQIKIDQLEAEISILKDKIIEQDSLKEQLRHSQKMESLAALTSGVAHDINNILQSILGYTQLAIMKEAEGDYEYRPFSEIEGFIDKGCKLTRQFLDFSLKRERKFSPLDINKCVQEVWNLIRRTFPKMIHIEMKLAKDLKEIHADAYQIDQVLINLCINARDAMPEGGKLTLTTENISINHDHANIPYGKYTLLTISDTGYGMSQGRIQDICTPFFTTKENGKGTGLGLSVVSSIIKDHNGYLDFSSNVGEGTTCRIYFPLLQPRDTDPDMGALIEREYTTGSNETILLVDDEIDILKICTKMLKRYGYTVVTANNGEEALQRYSPKDVDLVVLDIGMPGIGGTECLKELMKIDKETTILVTSGYSSYERKQEVLELGARAFLAKPYTVSELLKVLRELLEED